MGADVEVSTGKDPFFKVRVPRELMEQIRITCARRKTTGEEPNTHQDIGLAALLNYFDPPGSEKEGELEEKLDKLVYLVSQAAAKLRHFGHRDASTSLVVELTDLGFEAHLEDVGIDEPEETRRS